MQIYRRRKAYWQWLGMFAAVSGENLPLPKLAEVTAELEYRKGFAVVADKLNRELAREHFENEYPDPSDIQAMRDEPPATVAIVEIEVFGAVARKKFGTIQETLEWLQTLIANQVEFTVIYPG